MSVRIGNREVGIGFPPYFIADIASNHDGDLARAVNLIELARENKADAVKFQNFKAEKIVSKKGFAALGRQLSHQASWDKPVYEAYREASIPPGWTKKLKEKCDELGIEYLSSPYDFESVDLIEPYVNVYKIGSGDISWLAMLEYIGKKGKPAILSTGASDISEVRQAMRILLSINKDIILMQCNTNYTAGSDNFKFINLNVLKLYEKEFPQAVLGLSDHTYGCSTVLGALALGARVFEKHFTDDNSRRGPDHKFSMDPKAWREMVERSEELYPALGDGVKRVEENEKETVFLQRRSLRFAGNFKRGHILREKDLFPLRPASPQGITPRQIKDAVGKKLKRDCFEDDLLLREDIL